MGAAHGVGILTEMYVTYMIPYLKECGGRRSNGSTSFSLGNMHKPLGNIYR